MRHLTSRLARSTSLRTFSSSTVRPQSTATTPSSPTAASSSRSAGSTSSSTSTSSDTANVPRRPTLKDRAFENLAHTAETPLVTAGPPSSSFRAPTKPPRASPSDTHNADEIDLSAFSPNQTEKLEPMEFKPREGQLMRGFGALASGASGEEDDVNEGVLPDKNDKAVFARRQPRRRLFRGSSETSEAGPSSSRRPPIRSIPKAAVIVKGSRRRPRRVQLHEGPPPKQPSTLTELTPHESAPKDDQAVAGRILQFPGTGTVELRKGYCLARSRHDKFPPAIVTYARLRELCACPKCVHPSTRQRLWTMGELYKEVLDGGMNDYDPSQGERIKLRGGKLVVDWGGSRDHVSAISFGRLTSAFPGTTGSMRYLTHDCERQVWSPKSLATLPDLSTPYKSLFPQSMAGQVDDDVLNKVLRRLQISGFAKLTGVPVQETDNESCTLRKVATSIGPIRNTFYKELWNVRNEPSSKNVAYTDLNLGLHMDLLYHTEPPRFQLLHCLRNRVQGGESYFVDSFRIASLFTHYYPKEARLLREVQLSFEYDNDGHYMHQRRPIFPDDINERFQLSTSLNWSPPFQGIKRTFDALRQDKIPGSRKSSAYTEKVVELDTAFWEALSKWETMLNGARNQYEFLMKEGDLILFDNRRVLHARRAFRDWSEAERADRGIEVVEGEPTRWLKGCYLDGDTVWDKLIALRKHTNAS